MPRGLACLLVLLLLLPADADAKGKRTAEKTSSGHSSTGRPKAIGVERDSRGRIARNATARRDFKQSNPCPATGKATGACPGYVIDHIHALKRGGPDTPSNMQWQTHAEAKAKDKVE